MPDKLTPQIAKLIVLQLAKSSAEKYREVADHESLSPDERPIMAKAVENYIEQLAENIRYQEKVAHERI